MPFSMSVERCIQGSVGDRLVVSVGDRLVVLLECSHYIGASAGAVEGVAGLHVRVLLLLGS